MYLKKMFHLRTRKEIAENAHKCLSCFDYWIQWENNLFIFVRTRIILAKITNKMKERKCFLISL